MPGRAEEAARGNRLVVGGLVGRKDSLVTPRLNWLRRLRDPAGIMSVVELVTFFKFIIIINN